MTFSEQTISTAFFASFVYIHDLWLVYIGRVKFVLFKVKLNMKEATIILIKKCWIFIGTQFNIELLFNCIH